MLLEIKAKHFKGTSFVGLDGGCALEKAAKDQFNIKDVTEFVHDIEIGDVNYSHIRYSNKIFNKDKEKAEKLRYSNEIIRRIRLKAI